MAARPAGFAEVEGAEIARAFSALFYLRLLAFPLVVGLTLWHWNETGRGQGHLLGLLAFYAAVAGYLIVIARQRRGRLQPSMGFGLIGSIGVTLGTCFLSGGLDSPYVVIVPITAATIAMASDRRHTLAGAAIIVASLPLLALVGGTRPGFTIVLLLLGVGVGTRTGRTTRHMFEQMLVRVLEARADMLRMHAEQLETLTTLSGEIANELRTPLASIRGLSGLALKELDDPRRASERLEVLRQETIRMQRILEEFLNFSRPLSPLSLDSVDARRICREAADLFQGQARERRVRVEVSGEAGAIRCDPRKIRQVIINLVQNSLEASGPGGEIRLEVEQRPKEIAIRVLDRGHGLAAEVAERVFQAGVTTKEAGSGLGLTIARSIAGQHGGTLSLHPRAGGGCVAELVLPSASRALLEGRAA